MVSAFAPSRLGVFFISLAGLAALAHAIRQGTGPILDPTGSKEPIITVPTDPTPDSGINGSIQAPSGGSSSVPVAAMQMGGSIQYTTFAVRAQDWNDANPQVPTSRPAGILGNFVDTWTYDGTGSNRHNYHFDVNGQQEGTVFYIVVKTTTATSTTYSKASVTIHRAN